MLRTALVVSAALHGLLGMWVEVRGTARPPVQPVLTDAWAGRSIEVDEMPLASETPTNDTSRGDAPPADDATTGAPDATNVTPVTAAAPHKFPNKPAKPPPTERSPVAPAASTDETAPRVANVTNTANVASSANNTNVTNAASSANGQTFGAAGLPAGVRHLPAAFTRALSIADRGDPRWLTLPAGTAGEARIELSVDADGKLGELTFADERARDALAPVVRHLLENTRLLLASGHFSLDASSARAGIERLRVRVEVVEKPAASDGDPNELNELDYEPPTRSKPGRGSFALNSGRRVIGWVYVD